MSELKAIGESIGSDWGTREHYEAAKRAILTNYDPQTEYKAGDLIYCRHCGGKKTLDMPKKIRTRATRARGGISDDERKRSACGLRKRFVFRLECGRNGRHDGRISDGNRALRKFLSEFRSSARIGTRNMVIRRSRHGQDVHSGGNAENAAKKRRSGDIHNVVKDICGDKSNV